MAMSTTEHLQLLQKERRTEDEKKNLDNYKQKFEPQCSARYLASKGGIDLSVTLFDITVLIGGGVGGVLPG